ncbi:MAG: response regulator [Sphingobium sp.]|nr:response regulator [Sphingobium sp.]MBP6112889.1 response regulator [Sphingobium sp.]MBP8672186.1 response regulator [Sphingobium sp.]MBP9156827.1 response regulator [Sphingobium sp.]MCC6480890.1 response regulator [Sphingomonadaceae bacterium]
MILRATIAPELPYLRRYARTITGSQALGDAAVREMLEALLLAPDSIDLGKPPRIELYRIFHKLWQPGGTGIESTRPTAHLDERTRYVLMLSAVEGFSEDEVSEIIGIAPDQVRQALNYAREAITAELLSEVLIIEDEPIIALHIRSIVEDLGHTVQGIAATHKDAVALARLHQPELVLADISLADGSNGIDAVRDILDDIEVPVIFVTAYPERLLTGERPEPTYLITKPFDADVLAATIGQALMFHREGRELESETSQRNAARA